MIGAHQSLLDVCLLEPVLDGNATQYKVDPRSEVARPGIDLLLPVGEHAFAVRVKLATKIVQYWLFSSLITLTRYVSIQQELIEDAPVGCAQVLVMRHPLGPHVILCPCSINQVPGDVQISSEYNIPPHLRQIAYPRLQRGEKADAKPVS